MNERQLRLKRLNQNTTSVVDRLRKQNILIVTRWDVQKWIKGKHVSAFQQKLIEEFLDKYEKYLIRKRKWMMKKRPNTLYTAKQGSYPQYMV